MTEHTSSSSMASMRKFRIIIEVEFEEGSCPDDISTDIDINLRRAVGEGLLTDLEGKAIVDRYDVEVEEQY